jgi:hypothetical protein
VTYKQQQKLHSMRLNLAKLYKAYNVNTDSALSGKLFRAWQKAQADLDAYSEKVFNAEKRIAQKRF